MHRYDGGWRQRQSSCVVHVTGRYPARNRCQFGADSIDPPRSSANAAQRWFGITPCGQTPAGHNLHNFRSFSYFSENILFNRSASLRHTQLSRHRDYPTNEPSSSLQTSWFGLRAFTKFSTISVKPSMTMIIHTKSMKVQATVRL